MEIDYFTTDEEIAKILGKRIQHERLAQNIKQERLAEMAEVKLYVVRDLEQHGKIRLLNLISIIRALRKTEIFKEMFDFEKERIEVDAHRYKKEIMSNNRKRVYDGQ